MVRAAARPWDRDKTRQVVPRVGAGGEYGRQGLAVDQLHCVIGAAVLQLADLMDRRDAGMLQLPRYPGLLDEPPPLLGRGMADEHHLERPFHVLKGCSTGIYE